MQNFPANYKRWRSKTIKLHERTPPGWPANNGPRLLMGITTINRWDYLEKFLKSWLRTRNNSYNWTLVVADDGSTDGTIENILAFEIPNTKVVVLQNNGNGIARQTNSIFNYVMGLEKRPQLIFSSDDDIYFKQRGWDSAYLEAVEKTGYEHFVHFNSNWKPPIHDVTISKDGVDLKSLTDGISCMGCFYTVTPAMLEEIGGFDEDAFPIRGHSHIDFTMRACRSGYNDIDTLFDLTDAVEFIGIHPKEGYISTARRYSYVEQMILSDPGDKNRRWDLVNDPSRKIVDLPVYEFLSPEECHFNITRTTTRDSRDLQEHLKLQQYKDIIQKHHEIPDNSDYNPLKRWSIKDNRLQFNYKEMKVWWEMPEDFSFEATHPDLFKLAEFVLLLPFEPDILEGWVPSRKPGFRPGLAFSAGCDSTAAMELLPEQTVLMYHKRDGFESKLNHSNALRFIEHIETVHRRPVCIVSSNHELLRTLNGKQVGFVTDYACAVHVILLADYFGLDSIATGMPLENSYLWHGQKFRHFHETWFWKRHAPLFESVGLPILQPVMGSSEVINQIIVERAGFGDYAQSCLRAETGTTCGECWKCFRKNSLRGRKISISKEIDTYLNQKELKMAASTIYSVQKMEVLDNPFYKKLLREYKNLGEVIDQDVNFLESYYSPALELIPQKYRDFIHSRLLWYNVRMDTLESLEAFQLYD